MAYGRGGVWQAGKRSEEGKRGRRGGKGSPTHTRSLAARGVMVCPFLSPSFLCLASALSLLLSPVFALGPIHTHNARQVPQRQRRFSTASLSPAFEFHPLLSAPAAQNASGVRVRLFPRGVEALNLVSHRELSSDLDRMRGNPH